ncbi:tRNA synthetases class I, catalytic domain-containing protein [Scheffersomyces xylosifermentans]|uniref:tRNA synthetases class I, catalytic domain-containing protein n=1 Tax=Scheffersomyces xylosifermentans TaxID=1304137 RepID=UPI00315CCF80
MANPILEVCVSLKVGESHVCEIGSRIRDFAVIKSSERCEDSRLTKKTGPSLGHHKAEEIKSVHPTTPARTRFAPSPTGYLHLGSLRTALYNYLLAKNTGGQFLLRLEDTDRTRLVQDAEENIYQSLKWCNLEVDEGPNERGPYGPYRQSDRMEIYKKYAQILIDQGHAYRCSCSKERLNNLRESATKLKPPTTVTYDRKCLHDPSVSDEGNDTVLRFKSPDSYEPFEDLVHGSLNLQPQYNYNDRRYDDFVIIKSDGMPTYHFANVVDDYLMKITHVIRGEEWLPSTPKHIALYKAFGWEAPKFIHIPLLTSLEDKKLSKRSGDIGILSMKERGILPEALINFVALFGWSPARDVPGVSANESMSLKEIVEKFSLDHLTRGNAKVNDSKLYYFNKHHLNENIKNPAKLDAIVADYYPEFEKLSDGKYSKSIFKKLLENLGPSLTTLKDIESVHSYLFRPNIDSSISIEIAETLASKPLSSFKQVVQELLEEKTELKKKDVFQTVRYALSGGTPGLGVPVLIDTLGEEECKERLLAFAAFLKQITS